MARDPRYDILFEPVKIGPVTAKNRFFQVPHCNGMGFVWPQTQAKMREVKAQGGWGVINTEACEIHPTSDYSPDPLARLWDDRDIKPLALIADSIHRHDALAGVQLSHSGVGTPNYYSRMKAIGPSPQASLIGVPAQTRGMDKADIKEFRRWHRDAAIRAKQADIDIVYVYAGHNLNLLLHFLQRRHNHRTDEYGGSLENRVRLLREVLEDTKEAVGDRCAVAIRLAVDELLGEDGITCQSEGREIVEMLAEIPDLWDVNVSDWANDSVPSRYGEEGQQEPYISFVKSVTTKPVVGVGWFTSPDTMVSQIKRGVIDLIGAARPSIADPYLPNKIDEGRVDEIRECIGCNMCVAGQHTYTPMRCTQNPTMGEEWRRGWHPENIDPKGSEDSILVVGSGPAGLEAARALGQRGYQVTLAEASTELGGRVNWESSLPGLNAWARVRDWRVGRIQNMPNVDVYFDSKLTAENILDFGFANVLIATGAKWRKDGLGVNNTAPIAGSDKDNVFTPEDIVSGKQLPKTVVVFDDENFYMGGLIAEKLCKAGHDVTYITTDACVSSYTEKTLEQHRIQAGLIEMGVDIILSHNLAEVDDSEIEISCMYSERTRTVATEAVVMVTSRIPNNDLYVEVTKDKEKLEAVGIKSVKAIGDCDVPATIAMAVYDGHLVAREMDNPPENPDMPFKREYIELADSV